MIGATFNRCDEGGSSGARRLRRGAQPMGRGGSAREAFRTIVKSPESGCRLRSPILIVADQALESVRKLMVEFGMTPSGRSRLKMSDMGNAGDAFDLPVANGVRAFFENFLRDSKDQFANQPLELLE
jgi:Phage terminase, small subunit